MLLLGPPTALPGKLVLLVRPLKEVPWMVEMMVLKTSPTVSTVVFPSSLLWAMQTGPKRLFLVKVIIITIHVNELPRVEENVEKCAGG
jgi:hypothetical protein